MLEILGGCESLKEVGGGEGVVVDAMDGFFLELAPMRKKLALISSLHILPQ